jgi:hypothetical protein
VALKLKVLFSQLKYQFLNRKELFLKQLLKLEELLRNLGELFLELKELFLNTRELSLKLEELCLTPKDLFLKLEKLFLVWKSC